ncbi:hypothetical protein BJ912DRAFT_974732 [Pholiota molesta]|nr:hypothetical protein BJ912DRAFT_974732 [Pholiota molesta]
MPNMSSEPPLLSTPFELKAMEFDDIDSPTESKVPYDGKSTVIYAPDRETQLKGKSVFLAGSIDLGHAEEWQQVVIDRFKDLEITIYNPRRLDWNRSWKQKKSYAPFAEQVNWELDMLEKADVIMMYFAPLLELGTFGTHSNRMIAGQCDIVCERYKIEMVDNLDKLVAAARKRLLALSSEEQIHDV